MKWLKKLHKTLFEMLKSLFILFFPEYEKEEFTKDDKQDMTVFFVVTIFIIIMLNIADL